MKQTNNLMTQMVIASYELADIPNPPETIVLVHNMGCVPIVQCYYSPNPGDALVQFTPDSITITDSNTVTIDVHTIDPDNGVTIVVLGMLRMHDFMQTIKSNLP